MKIVNFQIDKSKKFEILEKLSKNYNLFITFYQDRIKKGACGWLLMNTEQVILRSLIDTEQAVMWSFCIALEV